MGKIQGRFIMPYIDKTPVNSVKEAISLWEGVMHDPNIDGFNGFACFKKIMQVKWAAEKALENVPPYYGLDDWVEENEPKEEVKEGSFYGYKAKHDNFYPGLDD